MGRHNASEVEVAGAWCRSLCDIRRQGFTDLNDGDVVRYLLHRLNEERINCSLTVLRRETHLAASKVGDVDKSGGARRGSGGLEHGGGESSAVGDLVELPRTEVVEEDMEG